VEPDHWHSGQTTDPASKAPTTDGRILRRAPGPAEHEVQVSPIRRLPPAALEPLALLLLAEQLDRLVVRRKFRCRNTRQGGVSQPGGLPRVVAAGVRTARRESDARGVAGRPDLGGETPMSNKAIARRLYEGPSGSCPGPGRGSLSRDRAGGESSGGRCGNSPRNRPGSSPGALALRRRGRRGGRTPRLRRRR
jgi:hypothetical protein